MSWILFYVGVSLLFAEIDPRNVLLFPPFQVPSLPRQHPPGSRKGHSAASCRWLPLNQRSRICLQTEALNKCWSLFKRPHILTVKLEKKTHLQVLLRHKDKKLWDTMRVWVCSVSLLSQPGGCGRLSVHEIKTEVSTHFLQSRHDRTYKGLHSKEGHNFWCSQTMH